MSLISVENLTFSYPGHYQNIFENVSFQIDTDWKLGFIGRNGRGKTTFLKLLMGEFEYSGKIVSKVKFGYFPFEIANKSRITLEIVEELCPQAEFWQICRELSLLEVDNDVLSRPFVTLSNGEQTKVMLASLFLKEGNFLLIDEPTNHLDVRGRDIVKKYLNKKRGFILVSHDRTFMDGCVDHVLSLNRANITVQQGNFTTWEENWRMRNEYEMDQNRKISAEAQRLEESARRAIGWAYTYEYKNIRHAPSPDMKERDIFKNRMMTKAKAIEARKNREAEKLKGLLKNVEKTEDLKIFPLKFHSEKLVTARNLGINYAQNSIFTDLTFEICRGDRVAVVGKNGCGKSSLLKLIAGENMEHCGDINVASGLKISYVPQDFLGLQGDVKDFIIQNSLDETQFKTILDKLGFDKILYEKQLQDYSAGQKKKVLLAKSLSEQAHLYIWDEPLNYIDIFSRMQIERLITQYQPTMILVEHDRTFLDKVCNKTIEL